MALYRWQLLTPGDLVNKTMVNIEIPVGNEKSRLYRFFEMLPAVLSYGALILLVVLSLINPLFAGIYLLIIIITLLVKAIGIAFHTILGHKRLVAAQKVDWHSRLEDLTSPNQAIECQSKAIDRGFHSSIHLANLHKIAADPTSYPKQSEVYNAVIVATWNESYDILAPTIKAVLNGTYDPKKIILVFAYEERGGPQTEATAYRLQKEFGHRFHSFHLVSHPDGLPNELVGKGSNITCGGRYLQKWLSGQDIDPKNVIVTTLDSDNRPYKSYFDYVTYEFIVHKDRKHYAFQPVSLFLNNIWDAPAPMRVIATGNSFWNIISSMRPHTLRNFASHSQPLDALEEMNFWSTRTIVEDGHQYWRSYFHFNGDYTVIPIYVPIYQDAVLSDTLWKTLKAQFKQLRRWAYGASDVPYVATLLLNKGRKVPFIGGLARLLRLIDSHITLASVSIMVAVGGWVPLIINPEAVRSIEAQQLPEVISWIQRVAMIGLFITVFLAFKMLPPRPERYKRTRSVAMIAQWVLMPFTAIIYSAMAALNSQGRLFLGLYLDKFDITEKATHKSVARAKQAKKQ